MADISKQLDELMAKVGSVEEAVATIGDPSVHLGSDGSSLSYWGGEEAVSVTPAMSGGRVKQLPMRLPKGYKRGPWKSAGEYLRDGMHNSASGEFAKKLTAWQTANDPVYKSIQGMSAQALSDGGALVLPEFNSTIMERVYANDIWNRTDQYTVAGNNMTFVASAETSRANGSRAGGLQAYWTEEGGSTTATKPTLRRFSLKLKKLCVVVYLTEELIEDTGPALEQYVSRKVAEEFNFMVGNAVFRGTGAGQPLGIFNAPALLTIAKEVSQTAATIVSANVDKMWARRLDQGAYAWYHNKDCGPQLDNLSQSIGTAGVALYRPADGLAGVAPQLLKTAPRVETEFASTLGTVGDICLADLGQYVTISKGGINQAISTHVEFLTGQTALRFTMRIDGQPWEASPITPFQGSNTQSAFLTLATRA